MNERSKRTCVLWIKNKNNCINILPEIRRFFTIHTLLQKFQDYALITARVLNFAIFNQGDNYHKTVLWPTSPCRRPVSTQLGGDSQAEESILTARRSSKSLKTTTQKYVDGQSGKHTQNHYQGHKTTFYFTVRQVWVTGVDVDHLTVLR